MEKFSLVKNTYNKEEALTVISELFSTKIKSLSAIKFSNEIKYGDDKGCGDRILELQEELENYKEYIFTLDDDVELSVNVDINVKLG